MARSNDSMSSSIDPEVMSVINAYRYDLEKYCRMLAGTPWDADDLYQETIMKALQSTVSLVCHPAPKAYFFRIATHSWIDHCRKNKRPLSNYDDEWSPVSQKDIEFDVREAMERVVHRLPPRQVAIVLLVDVFGFTAASTAAMMDVTEGAIKAALHRARTTLSKVEIEERQERLHLQSKSAAGLVDLFLQAFRQHDPSAILRVYQTLQNRGVQVSRIASEQRFSFQFQDPDGNVFAVVTHAP